MQLANDTFIVLIQDFTTIIIIITCIGNVLNGSHCSANKTKQEKRLKKEKTALYLFWFAHDFMESCKQRNCNNNNEKSNNSHAQQASKQVINKSTLYFCNNNAFWTQLMCVCVYAGAFYIGMLEPDDHCHC